jgi:hypothetical protein
MTCRVCGCTDENACAGGCVWIEPGLCSICALAAEALVEWGSRAVSPNVSRLFDEVFSRERAREPDADEPLIILAGS